MTARRVLLTSLLLAALVASSAAPALGHAEWVTSAPRPNAIFEDPPPLVSVSLTEDISAGSGQIRVTSPSGARVDQNGTHLQGGDARVMSSDLAPSLPPGVYTVAWSATSAVDGHHSAGSFAFAVQDANGSIHGVLPALSVPEQEAPDPAEVALRIASFLTMTLFVGAAALAALVWAPAVRRGGEDSHERSLTTLRLLLLWATGNAGAFAAVTLAWFSYSLGSALAEGATVSLATPFNLSMLLRISFGAGAAALLFVARGRPLLPARSLDPLLLAALAASLGAVGATSTASHAAASASLGASGAVLDGLHLGAVTTWVGGLIALALVRPALVAPHTAQVAAPALQRFSLLATLCVGTTLLAGVALAVLEVATVERLFSTTFGTLVLAKALLFVPLVGLAAWNRFRHVPKLARPSRRAPAVRHILARVRFEVALGAVILVLAAVLTAVSPAAAPPPPAPEPFVLHQTQGDVRLDLAFSPTPSVPQSYSLQVTLWNASTGAEVVGASNLTVRFALLNGTLPATTILFEGPHGNHFFRDTPALSQPGTWSLDGRVRRSDGSDLAFHFEISLRPA